MIQLYAVVARLREPLRDGFDAVRLGSLAAVVGPVVDDPVEQGLVVQELLESADAVLPVRFGERFADTSALRAALEPRLDELRDRLAAVSGCVELAVRVSRPSSAPIGPPAAGGDYLRSRLRAVTADDAAADALHALLARQARESVVADRTLSPLLHDACYLVDRDGVDAFADRVEAYAVAHPDLSLVCTGPWAPASFVGTE